MKRKKQISIDNLQKLKQITDQNKRIKEAKKRLRQGYYSTDNEIFDEIIDKFIDSLLDYL